MLRRWLRHRDHGNAFLLELEGQTWDELYGNDFLAMPKPGRKSESDVLSRFFLGPAIDGYHCVLGRFYKVRIRDVQPYCVTAFSRVHHPSSLIPFEFTVLTLIITERVFGRHSREPSHDSV